MASVLVCDDSSMSRETLRRSIALVPGVSRVDVASCGEEVLQRWPSERPDLVLMDVRMPGMGGMEAARRLVMSYPEAVVVMLTVAQDRDAVSRAIAAGARGFLTKDATREEISATVSFALESRAWVSAQRRPRELLAGEPPALTERELQVLEGMSRGRSNSEIGKELFLSEDTVKTHARRLFRKIGAADRAQAAALGYRWGYVS
ncbi:MAG: response regulator transcription factor [Actinomycetes bacterium]|nr:response regulator [Actinomycetota bacterium]